MENLWVERQSQCEINKSKDRITTEDWKMSHVIYMNDLKIIGIKRKFYRSLTKFCKIVICGIELNWGIEKCWILLRYGMKENQQNEMNFATNKLSKRWTGKKITVISEYWKQVDSNGIK